MKKIILGVVIVITVFSYQKSFYDCDESQLITENVEALSKEEETPQQPDISDCIKDKEFSCIALHPTDPSKDQQKDYAKWP